MGRRPHCVFLYLAHPLSGLWNVPLFGLNHAFEIFFTQCVKSKSNGHAA